MANNRLKVHILFKFIEGPWGGGNQFLKALREYFRKVGVYSESLGDADIILFNSHHCFNELFIVKQKYPNKILIHRVDGPISYIRGRDRTIDKAISKFNRLFADGTIFQSNWCMKQNKERFNINSKYETVIYNAPDSEIFNRNGKTKFNPQKVKLIASSWSSNWRKGFEVYQFLDGNLDFSKYELTFIGNSPIAFKNIKHVKPVPSVKLAPILKEHDIFITASQNDPCSNILIEALSCGLPAVVLNDGGHPELVKEGGELFNSTTDLIAKIEKVAQNHSYFQSRIPGFSINQVAQDYYDFALAIYLDIEKGIYRPRMVNIKTRITFYNLKFMIFLWKESNKLRAVKDRIC